MDENRLLAESKDAGNSSPYSVSEISADIKQLVERRFGHVRVRGELSGFKRAASGHGYFGLKDERAIIDAVMWRGNMGRLAFQPEDGIEVVATGKITTYAGRSKYQIIVDNMEVSGEGALMQLLEKLKARLLAEGLFDPQRKKNLPYMPRHIAVVTSPTGAVIRDILHRLDDRMPVHVTVWPVKVQGEGAAAEITRALHGISALYRDNSCRAPDLVIVARGGGSIEDLWPFNEEAVVRAIAQSPIPIISAVGHETDTTLSDYAADLRAPTPTAAAEIAVPVAQDLRLDLEEKRVRLRHIAARELTRHALNLSLPQSLLPKLNELLRPAQQILDEKSDQLISLGKDRITAKDRQLSHIGAGLRPFLLERVKERADQSFDGVRRRLTLSHPDAPLERGYARVSGVGDSVITRKKHVENGDRLALHFYDGILPVQVLEKGQIRSSPSSLKAVEAAPHSSLKKRKSSKEKSENGQTELF